MRTTRALGRYLNQTITVGGGAPDSEDAWGRVTYTARTQAARVEFDERTIEDAHGNLVKVTHKVTTNAAVGYEEVIWVPGADTTSREAAKTPRRIFNPVDRKARRGHWEIWL